MNKKTGNMRIRRSRADDIETLQAVEVSASKAFLAISGLNSFANDSCASREQHLSAIDPETSWVAEMEDGSPAGFLASLPEDKALHVYEISVHFDHQKNGVGRALMAHAEAHARSLGLKELTLTTFRHVPWNAPFYESLGFRIQSPEDMDDRLASILQKELDAGLPAPDKRCAMRKDIS